MDVVHLEKRGVDLPLGKIASSVLSAVRMDDIMKQLAPSIVNAIVAGADLLLTPTLPIVKDTGWGYGATFPYTQWGMAGNGPADPGSNLPQGSAARKQGAGDCWWAMFLHRLRMEAKLAGRPVPQVSDLTLLQGMYSPYSATINNGKAYNLQSGANDTGTDPLGAYKYLEKVPFKDDAGNTYPVSVPISLTPGNVQQHIVATRLFLGVGVGVNLQTAQADQFDEGQPLAYVQGSPIEGGHELLMVGPGAMVEWGERVPFEASFIEKCNDQSEAVFSVEMFNSVTGKDATGAKEIDVEAYASAISKQIAA